MGKTIKKMPIPAPDTASEPGDPGPGALANTDAASSLPLLVSLVRAMRDCCQRQEKEICRKLSLTPSELACLLAIQERDHKFSVHEVAKLMGLSQSRASRVIDSLACDGLLHRQTADSDRRTQLLALTPAGLKKWYAARKLMIECEQKVLASLTPQKSREMEELLKTLLKAWPGNNS